MFCSRFCSPGSKKLSQLKHQKKQDVGYTRATGFEDMYVEYIGHKAPETRETQGLRKRVRLKECAVRKHLKHEAHEVRDT